MPLSKKELKELEKLQQEFNRAIEKEKASIIEKFSSYVEKIKKLKSKADAQLDRALQEKQNTTYTNPYYESTYENNVKIDSTLRQIQELSQQARSIRQLFHQYEEQQKKLNAWFAQARNVDNLATLKRTLPVESMSFESGRMQAIVSKIIDFGTSPKPSSFLSRIKNAWNRLFTSQKSLPVTEARVEQVLTARPIEAHSFIEQSSVPIATHLPDSPVSASKLLHKLSHEIDSIEHNEQNDRLFATMEKTLEHSKTPPVIEKQRQNDTDTSEQLLIPPHQSAQ